MNRRLIVMAAAGVVVASCGPLTIYVGGAAGGNGGAMQSTTAAGSTGGKGDAATTSTTTADSTGGTGGAGGAATTTNTTTATTTTGTSGVAPPPSGCSCGCSLDGGDNGVIWMSSFDNAGDQRARALVLDSTGGPVIAGTMDLAPGSAGVDFGGGAVGANSPEGIFVAAYDTNGCYRWSKYIATVNNAPQVWAIASLADKVVVTGQVLGYADLSGGDGAPDASGGGPHVFVAAFDTSGHYLWGQLADGGVSSGNAVAINQGGVVVTGNLTGTLSLPGCADTGDAGGDAGDVFVAKLDPDTGSCVWSTTFSGSNGTGRGIAVDPSNDVFVTGDFGGSADGGAGCSMTAGAPGSDGFVAELASDGGCRWAKGFGSPMTDEHGRDVVLSSPYVVIVGNAGGDLDLGCGSMDAGAGGSTDIFAAALDGTGACVWSRRFRGGDPSIDDTTLPGVIRAAVAPSGDILLAGAFIGTLDFADGMTPSPHTSCSDISHLCRDLFVAELAPDGGTRWALPFGDIHGITDFEQSGYGVAADVTGVFVAGTGQPPPFDAGPNGDNVLLMKLGPSP